MSLIRVILLVITFLVSTTSLFAQLPKLDWAHNFGGFGNDNGHSLAIDKYGSVYLTGYFSFTADFNPDTTQTYNLTGFGGAFSDIFVLKLDSLGKFVWAKQMGGPRNSEGALSIALDDSLNVYTTGEARDTSDFDPGPNVYNLNKLAPSGLAYKYAYISKLDHNGDYVWAKQLAGHYIIGYDVIVDKIGSVYSTGHFLHKADFNPGLDTFYITPYNNWAVYISKLDINGDFVWAKELPGFHGNKLGLDNMANIFVAGSFGNSGDFDPGIGSHIMSAQGIDIFIEKLDSSGNFIWAKSIGGNLDEEATSLVIDSFKNIYLTGYFQGTVDFDPGIGIMNLTSSGNEDIFVLKLDSLGNFLWVKQFSGTSKNVANDLVLDHDKNIIVTGNFQGSIDFDPGSSVFSLTSSGDDDAFVLKLDSLGNFLWVQHLASAKRNWGRSVGIDKNSNIICAGSFTDQVDFDPDSLGSHLLNSPNYLDIFVHKLSKYVPVGVPEQDFGPNFSVYPNPSNGKLNIQLGQRLNEVTIRILSVQGKVISNITYNDQRNLDISIDGTSGIYFIEIKSSNNKFAKIKVLKR